MTNQKNCRRFDDNFLDNIRFQISRKISYFLLHYHRFRYALYLRDKLCRWLVPPPQGPMVCPHYLDIELLVDPIKGKGLEEDIYYFGVYEAGTISVIRKILKEGDIFVDVGANIGSISCLASRFVGKKGHVFAFEPHPETYKILEYNIRINNLSNVTTFNVALGSKISKGKIYDRLNMNRGAATLLRSRNVREEEGYEIEITTIDSLIENGLLPPPTLIKIDVEGFELEVLKGAEKLLRSDQAPMLCIEYSTLPPQYGSNTFDIYKFIKSVNGYSCYKFRYNKEVPCQLMRISGENDLPHHDNIFCFLDKHLHDLHRIGVFR